MSVLSNFIRNEIKGSFKHKIYGKCYTPSYNKNIALDSDIPDIYNQFGKKMDIFFIRDNHFKHSPYSIKSDYFLWDRYNFGLKTHFYTGTSITQTFGSPNKKFAWLMEPRSICEKPYLILEKNKVLAKDFDHIISFDEKILNDFDNAIFSQTQGIWCYFENGDSLKHNDEKYKSKDKNISMVVSGKNFTPLHLIRNNIADQLQKQGDVVVDLFGKYVNKPIRYKSQSLDAYRYQIVVENELSAYYFTEKILDCFISMCVPIYMGASKIKNFFNIDGIIEFKFGDDLNKILKQCNATDYLQRLEAIKENYYKSLEYIKIGNSIYENIFKKSQR